MPAESKNKRPELQHSYDKLKGIEGKPNFENLYTYLSKFFIPFANREYIEKIWDSEKASWNELKEKTMSMDSWKKQIFEKRAGEQSPCKKKTENERER